MDKKKGISSFKAIKEFSRENGIKKIGHTGTLDPLATGLLLVATDDDTKLIDYIDKGFKSYRASMILGASSTTYDIEGDLTHVSDSKISEEDFLAALKSFEGQTDQKPPIFSAKKVDGKRAYALAREGKSVELKTSRVTMKDFKLISYGQAIVFEVTVSRGTYIRSLIHDLGNKLGTGAYMSDLRRITIGNLTEENLSTEVDIKDMLTMAVVKVGEIKDIFDGKIVSFDHKEGSFIMEYQNELVGICQIKNKKLKPIKMFGKKIMKLLESKTI